MMILGALVVVGGMVVSAPAEETRTVADSWLAVADPVPGKALPPERSVPKETWLGQVAAAETTETVVKTETKEVVVERGGEKPPPWPLHTLEGLGGGVINPTAYLVNGGPPGTDIPLPTASFTYLYVGGRKSSQIFVASQTLYKRVGVSYALHRFDLGNLPRTISKATGGLAHIRQDLYLHNINLRGVLIQENSFDCPWLPQITAGFHFKYNTGIKSIDNELGNALEGIGYERHYGFDYTLTASKTVVLGRPFIFSGTLRNSAASNIGLTGFADDCQWSFEGNVICLLTDRIGLGYEFRQKSNPYDRVPGLLGDEGNWHAILLGFAITDRLTVAAAWARLGEVGNTDADGAWGVQVKYEF